MFEITRPFWLIMASEMGPKHFKRTMQSSVEREVAGSLQASFWVCDVSPPCAMVVEERVVRRADWGREEEGVVCEATEEGRRIDCPGCVCEGVCM